MRVVADENIPFLPEAVADWADATLLPGRAMTADAVRDADALFVRSVTKVDAGLLDGSAVRFVGTATIGTDHVDRACLDANGVGFSAAPGCNAVSVAEYITAALLVLAGRDGRPLAGRTLGVVGVGNVGSRVAACAEALGMRVLGNEPPRRGRLVAGEETPPAGGAGAPWAIRPLPATADDFLPLDTVLAESDAVTVHVPLERTGEHATLGMADDAFFGRMREGAWFLNASRGAVVDEAALGRALDGGRVGRAVLDVWRGEPAIDAALLRRVDLGTPHIAGYSFDGKVNGTAIVANAARRWFGVAPAWDPAPLLPPPEVPEVVLDATAGDREDALRRAVRAVYDIEADDARLRATADLPDAERAVAFDRLRKEYPRRREFRHTAVRPGGGDAALAAALRGLGFRLA